jgi:hypothetical protein
MENAMPRGEELRRRGKELYEQRVRLLVETPDNLGKIVSIDIESGDFEVDEDLLKATDRLLIRHPGAPIWGERIGYDAVFALGAGSLSRTSS